MSITRHHNEWLSLVPNSGPFLSLPVLAQALPQGLDSHDVDHARRLRLAFDEWYDNQMGKRPDTGLHRAWVKFVLSETLGYEELLAEGQAIPQTLKSEVAEYGETLKPDWIVNDPIAKKARLIVQVYPRSQSLTKPVAVSRWKVSPETRMMQLLHDTGIRLGLVTNGDHWMLVNAPKNETTGYASWYANLWLEEKDTLRAFRTLLGSDRLFSVPEGETLEALLEKSASDQQEVTDQLGYQVRKAVEVLIQALDKADQEHGRQLLADVNEKVLYESALTVMMRLVFLFCAEERELLLLGDELYDKNYAVSTLREQLRVTADQFGEEILGLRYDAWTRLLTTFRTVYAGAKHDRLKLPAYGGSLFNPDRFPFLEGRKFDTNWRNTEATPLPINNRTVLHLLEALQVLQTKISKTFEARKLSFRSLDIEQIGHVYEGLLDHTAKRATEPMLGLAGTRDKEPEIALADLEKIASKSEKELLKTLKEESGRSESAIKKSLNSELEDQLVSRFRTSCQDSELWNRVKPFAGAVRFDDVGYPIVITAGSVFVTSGTDRRSSGTHYTPKSLTEPIVQFTLEPLVYVGPAEGLPREEWKLRSAKELLALKICDMACGSGAFLVQVCRYLSARLLEAWDVIQLENIGSVRITPEGELSSGKPAEMLIPDDPDERQTYALRIVAQRCIYGVDINPLAVEMAKLSLWLLTLAKDQPFEFLDHNIRCGDSLVGIHNLDQLRKFSLDGKGQDNGLLLQFLDPKIKEAIALRRQISEMQSVTVEDIEAQDRMLREANEKIERLKLAADLLVAAEFVAGSATDKRAARDKAALKVAFHFNDGDLVTFRQEAQKALNGQKTFHWPLEFPEVMVERGGFDGFVGNPPFMGGTTISGRLGKLFHSFVTTNLSPIVASGGRADLCAYFLVRANQNLNRMGCIGFITTNTIAQGDTREISLDFLLGRSLSLIRATSSRQWPGTASLEVSLLWLCAFKWSGDAVLDEMRVAAITSFLTSGDTHSQVPHRLASNIGKACEGSKPMGSGFLISPEEAESLILASSKNRDVLFPYVNGDDFTSHPTHEASRWAINFSDWQQQRATTYSECWQIVEERVRPYRQEQDANGNYVRRSPLPERFWQYGDSRHSFYRKIDGQARILVAAQTAKYVSIGWLNTGIVFGQTLIMIADDSDSLFAVLTSSFHAEWIAKYCSSLETRLRYIVSDGFETFPFPISNAQLQHCGKNTEFLRRQIMITRNIGLTETYNAFHAKDIKFHDIHRLRQLYSEMDYAVAEAYGWTDLDLAHDFYKTKQGVRYTISETARREVLSRLLMLNHARFAEEKKQGLHDKKKAVAKKKLEPKEIKKQPSLFDNLEDT
jgi:hypothetical protein